MRTLTHEDQIDSSIRQSGYFLTHNGPYSDGIFSIQRLPNVGMIVNYRGQKVMEMTGGLVIRWKYNGTFDWIGELLETRRRRQFPRKEVTPRHAPVVCVGRT